MTMRRLASNTGATCEPREQTTALIAVGSAFLLTVATVIAAILLKGGTGELSDPASARLSTGAGGIGAGATGHSAGQGASQTGGGPGAALAGRGRGAADSGAPGNPAGDPTGSVVTIAPTDGSSLVDGKPREIPSWGFTTPSTKPPEPVTGATAVGKKNAQQGGGSAGAGGGSKTTFMGVPTEARRIVYIIDFTRSMDEDGRIEAAKRELGSSIRDLAADASFAVIVFAMPDEKSVQMPPEGVLVPASPAAKSAANAWITRQPTLDGATAPSDALRRALSLKPEAIYFLTDGSFYSVDVTRMFQAIQELDPEHAVVIHTIALHTEDGAATLQQLSDGSGGTYRYVPKP